MEDKWMGFPSLEVMPRENILPCNLVMVYSPIAKDSKQLFIFLKVALSGSMVRSLGSLKYPKGTFSGNSPLLNFCLIPLKMFSV